jgi:hypothetical protein
MGGIEGFLREGKIHNSPFTKLGPLTSHLKPHFAVVHAGDILADQDIQADFILSARQVLYSHLSTSTITQILPLVVYLRKEWGGCVPETDDTSQSKGAVSKRTVSDSHKNGSHQSKPLRSHKAKSHHGTENVREDDHASNLEGGGGKQNGALPGQPTDEGYHAASPFISPSTSQEIANQKHAKLVHMVDTWAQGILAFPRESIEVINARSHDL